MHTRAGSLTARLLRKAAAAGSAALRPAPGAEPRAPLRRRVRFTSYFYFQRSLNLWRLLIASLPFDALLASRDLHDTPLAAQADQVRGLLVALLVAVFLCDARSQLFTLGERISGFRKQLEQRTRRFQWLAIGFILAAIVADLAAKMANTSVLQILAVSAVVLVVSARRFARDLKEVRARSQRLQDDTALWIETENRKVFLITAVPLALARAVSLGGAFLASISDDPIRTYLVWLAAATALLLGGIPKREDFIIACPRCGNWTSKVLHRMRKCPSCTPADFGLAPEEKRR